MDRFWCQTNVGIACQVTLLHEQTLQRRESTALKPTVIADHMIRHTE
jgi:hypothetical protein